MMNTIMKQSSIRKFVTNNVAREPKLLNPKMNMNMNVNVGQSNTLTAGPKVISTIKPITNDFKISTQKKEINPTELLRSMKYNLGRSPGPKLNINTNYMINSNNNNNLSINKSQEETVNAIQSTTSINNTLLQSFDRMIIKQTESSIPNNQRLKKDNGDRQLQQKKDTEEMRKKNASTPKDGIKKKIYSKPTNPMSKPIDKLVFEQKYQSNNEQRFVPIMKKDNSNSNINGFNINNTSNISNNKTKKSSIINDLFNKKADIAIKPKTGKYMFEQDDDLAKANEESNKDNNPIAKNEAIIRNDNIIDNNVFIEESKIKPSFQRLSHLNELQQKKQEIISITSPEINEVDVFNDKREVIQYQTHVQQNNPIQQQKEQSNQLSIKIEKEVEQLKKQNKQLEKENEDLFKEIDIAQKKCEESLQQIKEVTIKHNKASIDLNQATSLNNTLEQKIKTMEEDIELLNEELSTKDLELQVANKNYLEYKASIESIELIRTINPHYHQQEIDYSSLPESEQNNKIIEFEKIIAELTQSLAKSCQERDYTANYYKSQIEELTNKCQSNQGIANSSSVKDDLIRQLTAKLNEYESINEELKTQMSSLFPVNDIYEKIIMEKDDLEAKYADLKSEYGKLKEDFLSDEELIKEHESMIKLHEKVEMNNKNELINAYDRIKQIEIQLAETEANERTLKDKIIQFKSLNANNNNIQINESIDQLKPIVNTKGNMSNLIAYSNQINQSSSIKSKIEMFERQSVLCQIDKIDNEDLKLRNQMIKCIIPKRVFDQISFDLFENLLTIRTIRKKTNEIILSILKNNILKDSNLAIKSEATSLEIDSMRQIIQFYCFIILLLIEYNSALFTIEINQSKSLNFYSSEDFNQIYMNILAGKQFIDLIIQLIKDDLLSIQYYQKLEGLKSIVEKLNDKLTNCSLGKCNISANMTKYYKCLLLFTVNIIRAYKTGKNGLVFKDTNTDSPLESCMKTLVNWFMNIEKSLKNISHCSFDYSSYENINNALEVNLSLYKQINKILDTKEYVTLTKDVYTNTWQMYLDNSLCLSNKLAIVISSLIDKIKKGVKVNDNKGNMNSIELAFLPQEEWNSKMQKINSELTSFANVKEDLELSNKKLKEERIENAQLKSQLEDLFRSKQYNDSLLTELNTKASMIPQLESSITDYQKKLKTYVHVIDDLIHKEEGYQSEINSYKSTLKEMTKELSAFKQGRRYVKPIKGQEVLNTNSNNTDNIDDGYYYSNYSDIAYSDLIYKKKLLKETIMKDKMLKLINSNNSYINKYLQDTSVTNGEKALLHKVTKEIQCFNKDYAKLRTTMPNVNEITMNKPKANSIKILEENKRLMQNIRIDYLQNASKILYTVLGNCIDDNAFKYYLHNDIERQLTKYSDNNKSIAVGVIKIDNNKQTSTKLNDNTGTISVLLTEDLLKYINETFIY